MSFELSYGTYDSTIDEKGRVIIPAPLRERYKGELVVTQGSPKCVWVMQPDVWKKFQNDLKQKQKKISPEQYRLLHYLHVFAARVTEIDRNTGRIPVAPAVRTYAGLVNKKCLVMSAEEHLEIWDSEYYYNYLNDKGEDIREASNTIGTWLFGFDDSNDQSSRDGEE